MMPTLPIISPIHRTVARPRRWTRTKPVHARDLTAWADGGGGENPSDSASSPPLFSINDAVNAKFVLASLSPLSLTGVDALVAVTNEALTSHIGMIGNIAALEDDDFTNNCAMIAPVQTGDSVLVSVSRLHVPGLVLAVPPRYRAQYHSASCNALIRTYRSCFNQLVQSSLSSMAVVNLATSTKGFDPVLAAHLALATVRRTMETLGQRVTMIVLVIENSTEYDLFHHLAPIYFPRCQSELERQRSELIVETREVELTYPERRIRIREAPTPSLPCSQSVSDITTSARKHSFPAPVPRSASVTPVQWADEVRAEREFATSVESRDEQFSFLHILPRSHSRPLTVQVTAKRFPGLSEARKEQALVDGVVRLLQSVARPTEPFVLVYDHRDCHANNLPSLPLLLALVRAVRHECAQRQFRDCFIIGADWKLWLPLYAVQPLVLTARIWRHIHFVADENEIDAFVQSHYSNNQLDRRVVGSEADAVL